MVKVFEGIFKGVIASNVSQWVYKYLLSAERLIS